MFKFQGPALEVRQRLLLDGNQSHSVAEKKKTFEFFPTNKSNVTNYSSSDLQFEDSSSVSKVSLIFFIGGCTYAELAAIRHLNLLFNGKR